MRTPGADTLRRKESEPETARTTDPVLARSFLFSALSVRPPATLWLPTLVLQPPRKPLHPLLFDRVYWHKRLSDNNLSRSSVFLTPRPELSSAWLEVHEFRLRSHDGIRLFGIRAECQQNLARSRALVRLLGPCDSPEPDASELLEGGTEFLVQEPAGRKLEDRVMDLLRVIRLAARHSGRPVSEVDLLSEGNPPDEVLIVSQLLADEEALRILSRADDESAGLDSLPD